MKCSECRQDLSKGFGFCYNPKCIAFVGRFKHEPDPEDPLEQSIKEAGAKINQIKAKCKEILILVEQIKEQ